MGMGAMEPASHDPLLILLIFLPHRAIIVVGAIFVAVLVTCRTASSCLTLRRRPSARLLDRGCGGDAGMDRCSRGMTVQLAVVA